MATTPKFAIPYVVPADALSTFPAADQAQATRVETLLAGGTINTSLALFTAATGWTVSEAQLVQLGALTYFRCLATRTGAAISVNTQGGMAWTTVATLDLTKARPVTNFPIAQLNASPDRLMGGQILNGGGLQIFSTSPGRPINTADTVNLCGWFISSVIMP